MARLLEFGHGKDRAHHNGGEAQMITPNEIHTLASRPTRSGNSVLTIYLDVDQSKQPNLNRGFESELHDMLANVIDGISDNDEMQRFQSASERIRDFVAAYDIRSRGLALAMDVADGFFWSKELDFPIGNQIRWNTEVFVQPLAAAIDEYEAVGIVLVDRANVRLFTMSLGRADEKIRERFDRTKVRHTKTVGMDHLGSASQAQRSADEQIRVNLRRVAKDIDSVLEKHGVRRVILAGSPEITAELKKHLSKHLASRVIGCIDVPMNATLKEIQNAAAPIAEHFERKTEETLVTDLVTSAAKSKHAVIGFAHTLHALNQGRVWQLLYVDGLHSTGYACPKCFALFSRFAEPGACSFCGSPTAAVDNIVEYAVDSAVRKGARVEVIRTGEPESVLLNAGGIGAFLKTRTASTRAS
jgi:hypothetical protein